MDKADNNPHDHKLKSPSLSLALSPSGHLYFYEDQEDTSGNAVDMTTDLSDKIQQVFKENFDKDGTVTDRTTIGQTVIGLLQLGITTFNEPLPPTFAFWQTFSQLFIAEVCKVSGQNDEAIQASFYIPPPLAHLTELITQAPFMRGSEYLTMEALSDLWQDLCQALKTALTLLAY